MIRHMKYFSLTTLILLFSVVLIGCNADPKTFNSNDVDYLEYGGALPDELPFTGAVRAGNLVFLSGQIGNIPGKLELVEGGIEAESRQTMDNIKDLLQGNGMSMNDVVKCTVMLTDMKEWPAFNEIYRTYFEPPYPARSALGANGLAIGARVEVECIASAAPKTLR